MVVICTQESIVPRVLLAPNMYAGDLFMVKTLSEHWGEYRPSILHSIDVANGHFVALWVSADSEGVYRYTDVS
jgi:hypothetical protein